MIIALVLALILFQIGTIIDGCYAWQEQKQPKRKNLLIVFWILFSITLILAIITTAKVYN